MQIIKQSVGIDVSKDPSALLHIQEVEIQEYSFTVIADNGDDRAVAPEQRFSFFMKKINDKLSNN